MTDRVPDFIAEYIDAFHSANGWKPNVVANGSWWIINKTSKKQRREIEAMTRVLRLRVSGRSKET